ncbi:MAG: hypothetical protein M1820_003795 [Bogoriella megaspora]|nr:MAG: hypothetical protein M1820_003795 [Bogoriella megaspora]
MATTSVQTPLPPTLTPDAAISALHNHPLMIRALCPSLITHSLESGDPSTSATYNVTDKKPIGQTTYKLTLTNVEDGVNSLVNAKPPVGTLTIKGEWRVKDGMLKEDVEIEGNLVMRKMAKSNVDGTHPKQHELLLQEALKA